MGIHSELRYKRERVIGYHSAYIKFLYIWRFQRGFMRYTRDSVVSGFELLHLPWPVVRWCFWDWAGQGGCGGLFAHPPPSYNIK